MDGTPHLAIFYATDASTWDSYLGRCFRELSPPGHLGSTLNIHHQAVEEISSPLTVSRNRLAKQAKAQIVILSPDFLDFVLHNPNLEVGRLFVPSRVLCLLCGIVAEEVTALHRAGLLSFDLWHTMTVVENDNDFVLSVVHKTIEIMQICDERVEKCAINAPPAQFKLNPRKVREGFAKVSIEFTTANVNNETVTIILESDGEHLCVATKVVNPYLVKFVVPDRYFGISQMVNVHVTRGTTVLGVRQLKCESQIAEMNHLLHSVLHPVSFMCQTLGIPRNRLEELDRVMADSFKKNLPRLVAYSPPPKSKHPENRKAEEELPTLLHFAAKFGLREVCATLLDCNSAEVACRLRNNRGLTPSEIAENESHHAIAAMLDNFLSLSETAEMYTYMSTMADDVCSVPIYENIDEIAVRCSRSSKTWSILTSNFEDIPPHLRYLGYKAKKMSDPCLQTDFSRLSEIEQVVQRRESDTNNPIERIKLYTQSQQELIQLLEDFKREKYTIAEVELLFRSWQLSQNVSQTFKEKDEQLKQMRQQYEQFQKQVGTDSRKNTTFDRLRNFWARNVKKDNRVPTIKDDNVYAREGFQDRDEMQHKVRERLQPINAWSNSNSSINDTNSTLSCSSVDSGLQCNCTEDKADTETQVLKRVDGMPKTLVNPLAIVMMDNKQYFECTPDSHYPPLPPRSNTKNVRRNRVVCAQTDFQKNIEQSPPVPPARPPTSLKPNGRIPQSIGIDLANMSTTTNTKGHSRNFRQSRPLPMVPPNTQISDAPNSYIPMNNANSPTLPPVIDEDPSYCNVIIDKSIDYLDMTAVAELALACAPPLPPLASRSVSTSSSPLTCHRMANCINTTSSYVNIPRIHPKNSYESSECVPDCPPPAIPTQLSN